MCCFCFSHWGLPCKCYIHFMKAARNTPYIFILQTTHFLGLTSSQVTASDWRAQELVNERCNVLRVVQVKVVSALDIMPFTPLYETQCAQVRLLALATLQYTPSSSDAQHPALYPGCTSQKEVFCQRTTPARLQPRITSQVISSADTTYMFIITQ